MHLGQDMPSIDTSDTADTSTAAPAAAAPIASAADQRKWYDVVGKFKDAVADYENAISTLQQKADIAAQDPTLQAAYSAIMDRYQTVQTEITKARDAVSSGISWLKSAVGLQGLRGLGFVQFLPLALVAGAVALVAYEAGKAWELAKKLDAFQSLQAQGMTADQAASTVAKVTGAGPSGGVVGFLLGDTGKWILGGLALAGVVFVFWKYGRRK